MGCHFLLQGIFPTQGLNLGLLHCRQMLYCPSHKESGKSKAYLASFFHFSYKTPAVTPTSFFSTSLTPWAEYLHLLQFCFALNPKACCWGMWCTRLQLVQASVRWMGAGEKMVDITTSCSSFSETTVSVLKLPIFLLSTGRGFGIL